MNIWLEAKVAKRILGKVRMVGERFKGPIYASLALARTGVVAQVDGPHPEVDRNAPIEPSALQLDDASAAGEDDTHPVDQAELARLLKADDHGDMGALLKSLGHDMPRTKTARRAALLALQED